MFISKIKAALSVVLIVAFMATGATLLAYRTAAGQEDTQQPKKDAKADPPADEAELTVDLAKKLLPEAAGISNADFTALSKNPRPETVKSKSLSLVLLALKPPGKNPDAHKEFRILGEGLKVSDILEAMWISKDKGYASFIQPKYITDCICKSTAERAEGVVTFESDLFAGHIPFVAQATKDGWIITEFQLPQYKIRVVRNKDGIWSQETLPDAKADPPAPKKE